MQIMTFRYIHHLYRTNSKLTYEVYIIAPKNIPGKGLVLISVNFIMVLKQKLNLKYAGEKMN